MDRSLRAVLLGTFTLRFSTGLTSSMLAFYLAHLGQHGGPSVDGFVVGLYAATFYLSELVLSPVFGIISDRYGHHRIMVFGPVFGATAVIITGLAPAFLVFGAAIMLVILAATRILEGASSAASVPSILGYIAIATAGNEVLRGKTSARFEAATLAGLGLGAIVGVQLFQFFENLGIGPAAFFLNAAFYGGLVPDLHVRGQRSARRGRGAGRRARPCRPLPRPDQVVARPACSPRPGSPSTRRSASG